MIAVGILKMKGKQCQECYIYNLHNKTHYSFGIQWDRHIVWFSPTGDDVLFISCDYII
jgi:hypothetical protein